MWFQLPSTQEILVGQIPMTSTWWCICAPTAASFQQEARMRMVNKVVGLVGEKHTSDLQDRDCIHERRGKVNESVLYF